MTPVPPVPAPSWVNATVLSYHDGDTGLFRLDRSLAPGLRDYSERDIRFVGCNAIELEDPGGQEALENLYAVLAPGSPVVLATVKSDKFGGRLDAQVFYRGPIGTRDLVVDLVALGWLAPWNGRGPKPVPAWPRPNFDAATTTARRCYARSAALEWIQS